MSLEPRPIFDVTSTERDGLAMVAVLGELDCATAPLLSNVLDDLAEPGRVVLVDLSCTEFMDCAGLASLVTAFAHQRELGGNVILDAPTSAVLRVIECTGLNRLMTVATSAYSPIQGEDHRVRGNSGVPVSEGCNP